MGLFLGNSPRGLAKRGALAGGILLGLLEALTALHTPASTGALLPWMMEAVVALDLRLCQLRSGGTGMAAIHGRADTVLSHVTAVGVSPRVGVPRAERE